MKPYLVKTALVAALVFWNAAPLRSAEPEKGPGQLVYVKTKDQPKDKDVEARIGDMIQFSVRFPIVPDGILNDLKVEIAGDGLKQVGVFRVPILSPDGRPLVGAGDLSAFLRAEKAGEVTVKITPLGREGKEKETLEFKVKVADKK